MQPVLFSQNDPRWKDIKVGTSNLTIGEIGCVITCIGMKYGLTPDKVNELLNNVPDGFVQSNLVNWTKLPVALPGSEFVYKYSYYDNEIVRQNLPCIVEVDATPIGGTTHWVLYVGNQILYDPFDGQAKSTSVYTPKSFVVLKGQYSQTQPTPTPQTVSTGSTVITLDSHGIDINNQASVQEVFDTWWKVANGQYVAKAQYDADVAQGKKMLCQPEDPHYTILKQRGYTTIDDVTKVIEAKDATNLALQKENAEIRQRNGELAGIVQRIENEDHTTHELGLQALQENKDLKDTLHDIARGMGLEQVSRKSIMQEVFKLVDFGQRFVKRLEDEQKLRQKPVVQKQEVVNSSEIDYTSKLIEILQLNSFGKEVKQ